MSEREKAGQVQTSEDSMWKVQNETEGGRRGESRTSERVRRAGTVMPRKSTDRV